MKLLVLDAEAIRKLIDMATVIEAVETAFAAYGRGEAAMPPKVYLNVPHGDFRAMPAALPGAAGIKWVNVHPDNPEKHGLPTVMGLIIYSDPETGRPLALLDGTCVTRMRTGAAAAVATKYLARRGARSLGIVGCGGQAVTHLQALTQVMKPERVLLTDAVEANARRVAGLFPQWECRVVGLEEACGADVVTTLTPSQTPVVKRAWVRPGAHINAMGADAPGKQELELDLLLAEGVRIFVDDWTQASHSGEINVAVERGLLKKVAGTLPDVVSGKSQGRLGEEEITIFDSTGLAIQDLSTAMRIYEAARRKGLGVEVEFAMG
jgi:ornithine cyclodeaminase/alanine dehydrogenase